MSPSVDQLVTMAERAGATIVRSPSATIIVLATATASEAAELLSLDTAASIAGVSTRTLREAISARDLAAFGKQRSRTVRRADLAAWVESRRVKPTAGPTDDDIERRVARLARNRK